MDASRRRKSNNGKRIRKLTRPICSIEVSVLEDETLCTVSGELLVFLGCPGPLFVHSLVVQRYRFPQYQKRSILWELEVVCNTHFRPSLLSFLNLALLLDRRFLIMHHISNVAS